MEFRKLRRSDDRSRFRCGNDDLDTFFRQFAGQNQFRHQIGVTYVLVEQSEILGYSTVAAHSLSLPPEHRGSVPYERLPVLLVARLAVGSEHTGKGLGKRLLRECALLALEQADRVGCVGLATKAKEEAIPFYRRFGFVELAEPGADGTQLHFLSARRIRQALEHENH